MDSPAVKAKGVGRPVEPKPAASRIAAARAMLEAEGLTIAEWARRHNEDPDVTYRVLSGTRSCRSGDSHRIAVKLGLKDGVIAAAKLATSDFGAMEPAR